MHLIAFIRIVEIISSFYLSLFLYSRGSKFQLFYTSRQEICKLGHNESRQHYERGVSTYWRPPLRPIPVFFLGADTENNDKKGTIAKFLLP